MTSSQLYISSRWDTSRLLVCLANRKSSTTEHLRPFLRLMACSYQWCLSFNSRWCLPFDELLLPKKSVQIFFVFVYWVTMAKKQVCRWHKRYKQSGNEMCMIVVDSWYIDIYGKLITGTHLSSLCVSLQACTVWPFTYVMVDKWCLKSR